MYTGSGNIGLEALSRGAKFCDFVDESKEAEKAVLKNIKNCNFIETAKFHHKDAIKYAANTEKTYDLIFLDPFYDNIHHVFLMQNLEEILKPEGSIIFFHGKNLDVQRVIKNTNLQVMDERKFGNSVFTILEHGTKLQQ